MRRAQIRPAIVVAALAAPFASALAHAEAYAGGALGIASVRGEFDSASFGVPTPAPSRVGSALAGPQLLQAAWGSLRGALGDGFVQPVA